MSNIQVTATRSLYWSTLKLLLLNLFKRVKKFILFHPRPLVFPQSEVYFKYLNKRWKMILDIRSIVPHWV